jgi:hypothetical protein
MINNIQTVLQGIGNIENILENYPAFQYNDKVFMTGEEWYRRFKEIMTTEYDLRGNKFTSVQAIEAARKASGL